MIGGEEIPTGPTRPRAACTLLRPVTCTSHVICATRLRVRLILTRCIVHKFISVPFALPITFAKPHGEDRHKGSARQCRRTRSHRFPAIVYSSGSQSARQRTPLQHLPGALRSSGRPHVWSLLLFTRTRDGYRFNMPCHWSASCSVRAANSVRSQRVPPVGKKPPSAASE